MNLKDDVKLVVFQVKFRKIYFGLVGTYSKIKLILFIFWKWAHVPWKKIVKFWLRSL